MSIHSRPAIEMVRRAVLAVTMLLFVGGHGNTQPAATQGSAPSVGPFDQLAGSWSGSGTIDLSHGRQEPIKCRASYGVLEEGEELETNLLQCKPGQSSVAQRTRALGWGFQCTRSRCNRPRQVKDQFPVGIPTNALCNLVTACASCSRCKISSFGMRPTVEAKSLRISANRPKLRCM